MGYYHAPFYPPPQQMMNRTPRGRDRRRNVPVRGVLPMAPLPMEPPPGVAPDPRPLRTYVDLDAPPEDSIQIDYGTPSTEKSGTD
jgi:hypothetical protein